MDFGGRRETRVVVSNFPTTFSYLWSYFEDLFSSKRVQWCRWVDLFTIYILVDPVHILYYDPKTDSYRRVVVEGLAGDQFRRRNGIGDRVLLFTFSAYPSHMETLSLCMTLTFFFGLLCSSLIYVTFRSIYIYRDKSSLAFVSIASMNTISLSHKSLCN